MAIGLGGLFYVACVAVPSLRFGTDAAGVSAFAFACSFGVIGEVEVGERVPVREPARGRGRHVPMVSRDRRA